MQVNESNLAFIPVKDTSGREYGRLYFVAHDIALHTRAVTVQKTLVGFLEHLHGVGITSDGRGTDAHSSAVIADLTEHFEAMVDTVCGVETSSEVFRALRPFAVTADGNFYANAVINALDTANATVLANLQQINQQIRQEANTPKWRKR